MEDEELTAAIAGGTGSGIGVGIGHAAPATGVLALVVAIVCGAISAFLFWYALNWQPNGGQQAAN